MSLGGQGYESASVGGCVDVARRPFFLFSLSNAEGA